MKYIPTIGLEIHAELKTKTKMFCNSLNDPDEKEPNVNICPICMGHPGTLPTLNKEAIKLVLKIGHAVNGNIADYTEWDRKNYFYPDIPKGYQISQYKYPLVSGGSISNIELTRIHLEEDTGTSIHDKGDYSLVNYNRAGVPLMELVTEPVIHSATDAASFAKELQLLLRYLNASDANMEKGEMRVEANISIAPEGSDVLGTKVEVKNLNSFKSVERAIEYEIERMEKLMEEGKGDEIVQETRGWDEKKQKTFSQRMKETSDDYRYFPDPDLPKLKISEVPEFSKDELIKDLPELPWEKRDRLSEKGLNDVQVEVLVSSDRYSELFDIASKELDSDEQVKLLGNYITSDLVSLENGVESKVDPQSISILIQMISNNEISSRGAKDILAVLVSEGGDPKQIAEDKGLKQESNEEALKEIAQSILDSNPDAVKEYKDGKEASLQYLIGQGMRETKGSANPQMLSKIFKELM